MSWADGPPQALSPTAEAAEDPSRLCGVPNLGVTGCTPHTRWGIIACCYATIQHLQAVMSVFIRLTRAS